MIAPDDFECFTASAYAPYTTPAEARAIAIEVAARERVADYIEHARERERERRREASRRVRDGFVAVLVSLLGVATFLALCFVWGR